MISPAQVQNLPSLKIISYFLHSNNTCELDNANLIKKSVFWGGGRLVRFWTCTSVFTARNYQGRGWDDILVIQLEVNRTWPFSRSFINLFPFNRILDLYSLTLESHTDAAIGVLCGYFFPRFHLPELLFDLSYTEDTLIVVSLLSFVRSIAKHFFWSFWFCCCVKERASSVKYNHSNGVLCTWNYGQRRKMDPFAGHSYTQLSAHF